jgi:hypothetical protein
VLGDGTTLHVGIRLMCASLPLATAPIPFSRPRVVLDLATAFTLMDACPIQPQALAIETPEDLDALYELVTDKERQLPVYLLTQPAAQPKQLPYLLDEGALAKKLLGLGIVVTLSKALNPRWSARVGKKWSAFNGAVRTYRPGLDFDRDAPTTHPLALAETILSAARDGTVPEAAFTEFLVEQAQTRAATRHLDWRPCLFYDEVTQREAERARARATGDAELRQLYEQEIDALGKRLEEANGVVGAYAEDVRSKDAQIEEAAAENRSLRIYLDSLRQQVEAQHLETGKSADSSIPIPATYDGLEEWVERHLAGRLQLHPRTARGLKNARYTDVELVYRALLALAREYRDMRLRSADDDQPRLAWDEKLAQLGLECSRSITEHLANEKGDTYFVAYPPSHPAGRRFLDSHLRKGKIKDDELCLAIYFFWDDDKREVVVGWLPSHLDNRMT